MGQAGGHNGKQRQATGSNGKQQEATGSNGSGSGSWYVSLPKELSVKVSLLQKSVLGVNWEFTEGTFCKSVTFTEVSSWSELGVHRRNFL